MTFKYGIAIILTILFMASCSRGYKIEDDKVYYEYWHEGLGFKQGKRQIEEADAKSFKSLSFDCDCSFEFGKDKNHLFINGEPIKNIDPNSFTFIGNYIFTDKDSAYFFGFYNDINDCAIKGINPGEIKLIEYPWAKAGNILIHGRDTVSLDEINDFIPFDEDWGKTKEFIINKNKIIYGADVKTFKVINSYTGEDEKYKYEFGFIADEILKKVSFKSFDFKNVNYCDFEPTEFVDIYNKLEPYDLERSKQIKILDKLKSNGFTILSIRQRNSGETKITSVTLTNNKCNCYIDKSYQLDYSRPSELENLYRLSEKIHCQIIK